MWVRASLSWVGSIPPLLEGGGEEGVEVEVKLGGSVEEFASVQASATEIKQAIPSDRAPRGRTRTAGP